MDQIKGDVFRHILFVINPIAGDIEKESLEEEIAYSCEQQEIVYAFYKTTGMDDKSRIATLLENNRYDAVFAVGGDGTVSLVASLLINTDMPMGIIPLGSGNGLSKDLKIPQDPDEALQLIHTHEIHSIDTLTLNGNQSIHLSDLGFNALVVTQFCNGDKRGPGAYAWIALQEFLAYEPKNYRIETDTLCYSGPAFMVTIANANAFGSNASINPSGILNDGKFEICLIEPFPKAAGIGILYKLYTDSIDTSVYTHRISCSWARIENLDEELAHVDGEPVELGRIIDVKMNTRSLRVILAVPDEE